MTQSGTATRRQAWRWGRSAEGLCVWFLRLRGYRILARDWRSPVGEIDIVARRGTIIAFVEVKARRGFDEAAWALGPQQQGRIARAAQAFFAARPDLARLDGRFDVMLVRPWRLPRHLTDAWRPDR